MVVPLLPAFACAQHHAQKQVVATDWLDTKWPNGVPDLEARSTTLDWLRCFDAAATQPRYVQALYGAFVPTFDWARLDVIFPDLLVGLNRTCLRLSKLVNTELILGGVFVDYTERTRVPNGNHINRGGPRVGMQPKSITTWPWVEVMHSPSYGIRDMEDGNLWMYVARGSGMWFNPGRVLALSDTWDLAEFLNETGRYNYLDLKSKAALMRRATERLHGTFDSISFAYHVDRGCCFKMVMRELVSLQNFSSRCPVSHSMRRGWPRHNLRHCDCASNVVYNESC